MKNDISEELRLVSELVATISRETPYRVADGYFADFPSRMLLRIQTQHKPLAFNVPEGYFEGFAEGMLARIKSGEGARPGFVSMKAVAETADQELNALSPLLAQLRSKETYRMPEGYFEELSPVLTLANKLTPYTVPSAYFQELPAEINQKISEPHEVKRPAKVVAFGGGRTRLWRYSAAAVVAGLILTIGWLRLQVSGGKPIKPAENMTTSLTRVSDQDLQSFLADQDTTLAQPVNVVAMQDFNDNDLKTFLGDVPDGELKQY
ncbi:MAG TPA: hypothetical protein VGM89_16830, partial [Puia sp.]